MYRPARAVKLSPVHRPNSYPDLIQRSSNYGKTELPPAPPVFLPCPAREVLQAKGNPRPIASPYTAAPAALDNRSSLRAQNSVAASVMIFGLPPRSLPVPAMIPRSPILGMAPEHTPLSMQTVQSRPALLQPGRSTIQRMESGSSGVHFGYTSAEIEKRDPVLLLAIQAYEHMRSLVIRNDKDSFKGKLRPEDLKAAEIYRGSQQVSEVSAFAIIDGQPHYAINASKNTTGFEVVESSDCNHAEMKLFQSLGSQTTYIGVSRLCRLYCAAQMLARGFRGFRGCHMKSFSGYQWLPEIDTDNGFRRALWGDDVARTLESQPELWQKFKQKISDGANLLSKFLQYYNAQYQPGVKKNETNPYSNLNQQNYL